MKLKHYEMICFIISIFLGYEYLIANQMISAPSFLITINQQFFPQYKLNLDPYPGHPLSYFLGWTGFLIMCTTNPYILRKRLSFMQGWGKLTGWLEFHIFCGILGPIFIIFHSNFKVQGLVSISFWSMVICSSSGIVGRYFYIQTLRKKDELRKNIESFKQKIIPTLATKHSPETQNSIFNFYLEKIGISDTITNPILVFFNCLKADLVFMFSNPGKKYNLTKSLNSELHSYALESRKLHFLQPFNQLLGYWHTFHLPFAVFMYLVAVIHIVTALLFGVKH